MQGRTLVLALGSLMTSTAHAQSSWVGSIQGGYSVSTSTAETFPAGGSFGSSAFIGRQLSPLFTLGIEGGFFGVENTTTVSRVDCPPPSVPGSLGCDETDRAELDWIQLGATGRIGKNDGRWRPYGALGLAIYFGTRDTEVSLANANTGRPIVFPRRQASTAPRLAEAWAADSTGCPTTSVRGPSVSRRGCTTSWVATRTASSAGIPS